MGGETEKISVTNKELKKLGEKETCYLAYHLLL